MGTGVFGGMIVATFVATIFVPLFFTVFARRQKMGEHAGEDETAGDAGGHGKEAP
jgi:hypothetical protein